MSIVQGWDVSLNHGAIVELEDGELNDFWFWTTVASSTKKSDGHGSRLILLKTDDKHLKSVHRLCWIRDYLQRVPLARKPDYIGIEDYAIRVEQGAHYLGEGGGVARIACWDNNVRFRLHDPVTVKMFAAHDGTAQKDSVERAVKSRWKADFSQCNPPIATAKEGSKNSPKQNRTTSEDLADAYAIARMVHVEVLIRSGNMLMNQLHPKEVQVFNRVTKTYPVNLLNREWVYKGDEGIRMTNKFVDKWERTLKKSKASLVRK